MLSYYLSLSLSLSLGVADFLFAQDLRPRTHAHTTQGFVWFAGVSKGSVPATASPAGKRFVLAESGDPDERSLLCAQVLQQRAVFKLKSRLPGLSSLRPWLCKLVPDRCFPVREAEAGGGPVQVVPLGSRNSVDRSVPQQFLLWRSLLPAQLHPLPVRTVSSIKWPNTEVLDWEALRDVGGLPDPLAMSPAALDRMLLACCWRHVAGIPDQALRNLVWLRATDEVFSVDEENAFRAQGPAPFRYRQEHRLALQARAAAAHEAFLGPTLSAWLPVFRDAITAAILPRHGDRPGDLSPAQLSEALQRLESLLQDGAAGVSALFDNRQQSEEPMEIPEKADQQQLPVSPLKRKREG